MTEKEYRNRLKKLESSIAVNRQKAIAAEQKNKAMEKQMKSLTRAQRTHRLCEHGALLGIKLIEPDLLSTEQVKTVLDVAFSHEDVKAILRKFLEKSFSEDPCE